MISPSPDRLRHAAAAGVAAVAAALVAGAYPIALGDAVARLGVRPVALSLLALVVLTLPLRVRLGMGSVWSAAPGVGLGALLAAAAITRDAVALRLVPAWIYACVAAAFAASLRAPDSIVERGARWLVPEAPDFIGSYCRATTAVWAVFLLGIGGITAALALSGSEAAWQRFTTRTAWSAMALFGLLEFLFRKSWFRYYARGGPFERVWSKLFPPERTARGRRSLAAIERYLEGRTR